MREYQYSQNHHTVCTIQENMPYNNSTDNLSKSKDHKTIYLSIYLYFNFYVLEQCRFNNCCQASVIIITCSMHNNTLKWVSRCQKLNKRSKLWLVQNQVWYQRHLVQQTVGGCCPGQTSSGGLVGDIGQEDVQVVLEKFKVPRIFISELLWQKVASRY